jgi:proteasome lid subunit RPN8/RPN11
LIFLPERLQEEIKAQGAQAYPHEGCGLILGSLEESDQQTKKAVRLFPTNNTREGEDKKRRFAINAEDFFRAEKTARELGLDVIGVYHSHPDHPAEPSQYDLDWALPFYSYVIVAIVEARAKELTSWLLAPDRSAFAKEPISD